ncbi:hypothetical protein [Cupriavidus pampae]|uniref:Uncharacterized protein n=1 Tax=Cupriavidus pampae TaxID=659251 RepID=A0ABM8XZK7_9BURK|nr:hypothetical protein [Cupriavidus pampae]CAG9185823.1 hypothetical protein LMG32289_06133 [Cupriavidus pampae]
MNKLEIKLTLTTDSTPELLHYLSGISSARDRAFILKRLATVGLSMLSEGAGTNAMLLPSPSTGVHRVSSASPSEPLHPMTSITADLATLPERTPATTLNGPRVAVPIPNAVPAAFSPMKRQTELPDAKERSHAAQPMGFEFLDLDALNAATAQFD